MIKYVFMAVYPDLELELQKPSEGCENLITKINKCLLKIKDMEVQNEERVPLVLKDHYKLYVIRYLYFQILDLFNNV